MKRLYCGGDIITMLSENDYAEALLIEDSKIVCVGSLQYVLMSIKDEDNVERINLNGKTLMPSFIDSHGHISMVAQVSFMANLSECQSFADIKHELNKYKDEKELGENDPIIAFGYDHNFLLENKHPDKRLLNEVSETNPIFTLHTSGHMGCVNDVALIVAGIDRNTPNPEGGVIGRNDDGYEPNGYLEESAMIMIQDTIYSSVKMDFKQLAINAQNQYIENGITTVQDGGASKETIQLLRTLADNNLLKVDVIAYPIMNYKPREIIKDNPESTNKYYNRFKIGGYKLLLDGSPQGKSAWLTQPYEGEETYRGYPWFKDEQVKEYIYAAINDDQQLLTHCNGDGAADQLLKIYSEVLRESENPNKYNLRPTMIHCQTVRYDQLDKMVDLNMIPSIFVAHTYYWGDIHLRNLGQERGNRISPAKSALDRGLCINFHQDSPVVKPLMLHTIWCAVNRLSRNGLVIGSHERIGVFDALKAVTINAAYQYFEEDIKGTLEPGKLADLVILDKNPLKVDIMEIKNIKVLETIKDGKTIFKKF